MKKLTFYIYHEGDPSVGIDSSEDEAVIFLPQDLYIVEEDIVDEFRKAVGNSFPDAIAILTEREKEISDLSWKTEDLDRYIFRLEGKLEESITKEERINIRRAIAKTKRKEQELEEKIMELKKEPDMVKV